MSVISDLESMLAERDAEINFLQRKLDDLDKQISELANWIINYVPGEPSQSEGAVDCAIRIMTELQRKLEIAKEALKDIATVKYGYMDSGWPAGIAKDALKQLEAE